MNTELHADALAILKAGAERAGLSIASRVLDDIGTEPAPLKLESPAIAEAAGRLEVAPTFAELVSHMTSEDLIEAATTARLKAAQMFRDAEEMETEVVRRMKAADATVLYHPDYEKIALEPKTTVDVRVDVLRELITLAESGQCDKKQVAKAIWLETPEPVWRTNRTHLKTLHKLGGRVAAIIDRGVHVEQTGVVLVVKRKAAK